MLLSTQDPRGAVFYDATNIKDQPVLLKQMAFRFVAAHA
jgi:hypothetical protein